VSARGPRAPRARAAPGADCAASGRRPAPSPPPPSPCASAVQATAAAVCVDCKRPRQPVETEADYRRRAAPPRACARAGARPRGGRRGSRGRGRAWCFVRRTILEHLFHEALGARLYKMAVSPEAPFFSASTSVSFPTSIVETCAIAISAPAGGELAALEAVMAEVERVKQHGFLEPEMRRAKAPRPLVNPASTPLHSPAPPLHFRPGHRDGDYRRRAEPTRCPRARGKRVHAHARARAPRQANLVADLEADHLERDQVRPEAGPTDALSRGGPD